MITTVDLQTLTRPELEALFAALGHDLVVVRPGAPTGDWDANGRQTVGPATRTPFRGLLLPADNGARQAAAASGLPVPSFTALLPWDAPVDTPGWHLEHGGQPYLPTADARDEGGQGVVWAVTLGGLGEVTSGPSE